MRVFNQLAFPLCLCCFQIPDLLPPNRTGEEDPGNGENTLWAWNFLSKGARESTHRSKTIDPFCGLFVCSLDPRVLLDWGPADSWVPSLSRGVFLVKGVRSTAGRIPWGRWCPQVHPLLSCQQPEESARGRLPPTHMHESPPEGPQCLGSLSSFSESHRGPSSPLFSGNQALG